MKTTLRRLTLVTALAILSSGCISRTTVVPPDQRLLPAQTRTRAELMQSLETQSRALETLNGKVKLDATGGSLKTGVLKDYAQTTGFILIERPSHIRVKVQALALTVFDMSSDGKQYKASVPYKSMFLIADANAPATSENPLGNLRPRHMLEALFVDVRPYVNNPSVRPMLEEATIGRASYYVLSFVDVSGDASRLLEKFWIDRSNLQVVRKQIFIEDGKLESDVEFSEYERFGDVMFPHVVFMQRPVEDYSLKITFERPSLKLNQSLPAEAFLLEPPAGFKVVENMGKPPTRLRED